MPGTIACSKAARPLKELFWQQTGEKGIGIPGGILEIIPAVETAAGAADLKRIVVFHLGIQCLPAADAVGQLPKLQQGFYQIGARMTAVLGRRSLIGRCSNGGNI